MCDYSLHAVATRPAQVGETLITTTFRGTSTRGFASESEPAVAVDPDVPHRHHDAIEFPDGSNVLVTQLCEGQRVTVLQLPVVHRITEPAQSAAGTNTTTSPVSIG
jgi:hypothetical protein